MSSISADSIFEWYPGPQGLGFFADGSARMSDRPATPEDIADHLADIEDRLDLSKPHIVSDESDDVICTYRRMNDYIGTTLSNHNDVTIIRPRHSPTGG